MHMTYETHGADIARPIGVISQVSWGAIFAGTAAALVVQLTLSILGVGIGLASINPASNGTPDAGSLSLAAGIWWIVSGIVASLTGGYIAGRFCDRVVASKAGYHGLMSWAVTTLVIVFLLSSAVGGVVGGAFGAVTNVLGGAGRAAGSAVQAAAPSLSGGDIMPDIERKIKAAGGGQDPAQLRDTAVNAVRAALTGDKAAQQQATDVAAQALAQAQGIPLDQAKAQVQQYQQQYVQAVADAKAKAAQIAHTTAKAASRGALIAFFALVLGAIAAGFGGRSGAARSLRDYADQRIIRSSPVNAGV
jgi:hypothetical protein